MLHVCYCVLCDLLMFIHLCFCLLCFLFVCTFCSVRSITFCKDQGKSKLCTEIQALKRIFFWYLSRKHVDITKLARTFGWKMADQVSCGCGPVSVTVSGGNIRQFPLSTDCLRHLNSLWFIAEPQELNLLHSSCTKKRKRKKKNQSDSRCIFAGWSYTWQCGTLQLNCSVLFLLCRKGNYMIINKRKVILE